MCLLCITQKWTPLPGEVNGEQQRPSSSSERRPHTFTGRSMPVPPPLLPQSPQATPAGCTRGRHWGADLHRRWMCPTPHTSVPATARRRRCAPGSATPLPHCAPGSAGVGRGGGDSGCHRSRRRLGGGREEAATLAAARSGAQEQHRANLRLNPWLVHRRRLLVGVPARVRRLFPSSTSRSSTLPAAAFAMSTPRRLQIGSVFPMVLATTSTLVSRLPDERDQGCFDRSSLNVVKHTINVFCKMITEYQMIFKNKTKGGGFLN